MTEGPTMTISSSYSAVLYVAVRPTSRFDRGWVEWIANLDTRGFYSLQLIDTAP